MADREKIIEGLEAMREFFGFGLPSQSPVFEAYQNILTDALELLKEQEGCENCAVAIEDRQPVVRCKDCHYGIRNSKEDIFCIKAIYNDKYKRPDWFCADGERRTEDA